MNVKKISFSVLMIFTIVGCAATENINAVKKSEVVNKYPETKEGSPFDQVYATVKDFHDYKGIQISQKLSYVNNTDEATVILIQDGWADDSITASRKEFKFRYIDNIWKKISVDETFKCGRGSDTTTFHKNMCP